MHDLHYWGRGRDKSYDSSAADDYNSCSFYNDGNNLAVPVAPRACKTDSCRNTCQSPHQQTQAPNTHVGSG